MATYAIGDIQGCYDELRRLLDVVAFEPSRDRLWIAGDIVNRGPQTLQVLRFIRSLEDGAIVTLGALSCSVPSDAVSVRATSAAARAAAASFMAWSLSARAASRRSSSRRPAGAVWPTHGRARSSR